MKIGFAVALLAATFLVYFSLFHLKLPGERRFLDRSSVRTESNGHFQIRITRRSKFYMRYEYSVLVADSKSSEWREVTSHIQDDWFSIEEAPIGFVAEEIGYFAFGNKYGVTVDGGKSFKFFKYNTDSEWGRSNGYVAVIQDVFLESKGFGVLVLEHNRFTDGAPCFITHDFGVTWVEKEPSFDSRCKSTKSFEPEG